MNTKLGMDTAPKIDGGQFKDRKYNIKVTYRVSDQDYDVKGEKTHPVRTVETLKSSQQEELEKRGLYFLSRNVVNYFQDLVESQLKLGGLSDSCQIFSIM